MNEVFVQFHFTMSMVAAHSSWVLVFFMPNNAMYFIEMSISWLCNGCSTFVCFMPNAMFLNEMSNMACMQSQIPTQAIKTWLAQNAFTWRKTSGIHIVIVVASKGSWNFTDYSWIETRFHVNTANFRTENTSHVLRSHESRTN